MEWLADPIWGGISGLIAVLVFITPVWKAISTRKKLNKKKLETAELKTENEINRVVNRFLILLKEHGISRAQIPRFLENKYELNLVDVSTNSNLLQSLNNGIIETVCNQFGVQREWLDGKDVPIYEPSFFDKSPVGFIDFLNDLRTQYENIEGFAIKSPNDRLEKKDYQSEIALIFRVKIEEEGKFREEGIYKYFPLFEIYYWGYKRTRLQLKAYIFIAWQFGISIYGCELPESTIAEIRQGIVFPGPYIEHLHRAAWHPDDYIFTEQESGAVKDAKEALEARDYLSHKRWMQKVVSLTGDIKAPLVSGVP